MGGTLIRHRDKSDWNTKVLCLTRASDKDRAPKFLKACKVLGVKGYIYDLEDNPDKMWSSEDAIKIIKRFCNQTYDLVFTHGRNGEYGHIAHKQLNKIINGIIDDKILKTRSLMNFAYLKRKNSYQGYAIPHSKTNNFIKLKNKELIIKKNLIKDVYGYKEGGFEEKSCNVVESFRKIK